MNYFRTFFLLTALTVMLVWIGGMVGGRQGAVIAFIVAGAMNFYAYWFSDKLVLRRYKAQEVSPEQNARLYSFVEELAKNADIPMPKVYIIPGKSPNAFATGRNPQNAAVATTEGILQLLDENELKGVLAHELAHIKNRDILTSTLAATMAGAVALLGQFARFGMAGRSRQNNMVGILLIAIAAPMAAMMIRMLISRVREYSADAGGAQISGQPLALANALNKLKHGVAKYPLENGNPAHSHMFIVNPFLGGLQKLFATHPPIEERIRRLELLAAKH